MRIHHARLVATVIALACVAPACASGATEEESGNGDLATVEPIEGRDVARVTLSPEAAERIDIQTSVVEPATGGRVRMTIPYSAVLYDPAGKTWTYTSPDPLVFVRAPIIVTRIDGDRALLSDGPRPGTEVVTVGAAELLGTEYEVGEQ